MVINGKYQSLFDALFPKTSPGQYPAEAYNISKEDNISGYRYYLVNIMKEFVMQKCLSCGQKTQWIDVNFIAHCCSIRCNERIWKEYEEALQ